MAPGWEVVQLLDVARTVESNGEEEDEEGMVDTGVDTGYIGQQQNDSERLAEMNAQLDRALRGWYRYLGLTGPVAAVRLGAPDTPRHWLESIAVTQTGEANSTVLDDSETGRGHRHAGLEQANGFAGNVGYKSQTWWSSDCMP